MRTLSDEHKVIWLEPSCGEDNAEGRQWCQDNVWGDKCDDCEAEPVKFIRADLVDAMVAAECERRFKPLIAAVERVGFEVLHDIDGRTFSVRHRTD